MDLVFKEPAEIFGFKVAGDAHNLADRLPETSPLRELYIDWEQRFVAMLLGFWGKQYSILISRLRQLLPDKSIKQDEGFIIDSLDDLWFAWANGYTEELLPYIEEAAGMGALTGSGVLSQMYNVGWDPVSTHATIAEWARTHVAKLVKKRSRMFRRTLVQNDIRAIRASVGNWIESGLPFEDLVSSLKGIVINPYRARMIAATEATRAYAQGARAVWLESEVIRSERWNTANDELVCEICGELAGRIAPIGEFEFPAHVNCRCWPTPVALPLPSPGEIDLNLEEYV